jgi:hypothetical protein
MQKWEYLTEAVPAAPLAQRGQDGWRLVAIDDGIMFFERPLEDAPVEVAADPATAEFFGRKIVPGEAVEEQPDKPVVSGEEAGFFSASHAPVEPVAPPPA